MVKSKFVRAAHLLRIKRHVRSYLLAFSTFQQNENVPFLSTIEMHEARRTQRFSSNRGYVIQRISHEIHIFVVSMQQQHRIEDLNSQSPWVHKLAVFTSIVRHKAKTWLKI